MKTVKIAMIGVGCISGIYLDNITKVFKEIELIGVCDLVRERAENAQKNYGVPKIYETMHDAFADPEVDIVLNLTRSRAGRAIMAIRDNPIAAQSVGLNLTKYKLMAFVTSAALAGAAGALYGLNYSSLQSVKFNFNTSILVLVFVVLGGLGNIWGSLISAAALTILPEALRQFADYRMLVYAIVLIFVMLATNNPRFKAFFAKLLPRRHSAEEKEV